MSGDVVCQKCVLEYSKLDQKIRCELHEYVRQRVLVEQLEAGGNRLTFVCLRHGTFTSFTDAKWEGNAL
jgi:hypothetical protein